MLEPIRSLKVAGAENERDLEPLLWEAGFSQEHSRCPEDAGFYTALYLSKTQLGVLGPALSCELCVLGTIARTRSDMRCLPELQHRWQALPSFGSFGSHETKQHISPFLSRGRIWKGHLLLPSIQALCRGLGGLLTNRHISPPQGRLAHPASEWWQPCDNCKWKLGMRECLCPPTAHHVFLW